MKDLSVYRGNRFTLALALFQRCIRTDDALIQYRSKVVQQEVTQLLKAMWMFMNLDREFNGRLKNGASLADVVSTMLAYCNAYERRKGSFWFGVFLLFTEAKVRMMWDHHHHPTKGLRAFAFTAGLQALVFNEA